MNTLPDITADTAQQASDVMRRILESSGEVTTYSHMTWLHRECCKHMWREAELAAQEEALARRERATNRRKSQNRPKHASE
jgi:hypothetical protein